MKITLELLQGGSRGSAREFDKTVVRIGRDPANDLVLDNPAYAGVSRHHAEIRWVEGAWRVIDLASTNGTYINGRRVSEAVLRDGDEVQLASRGPRLRVALAVGSVQTPYAAAEPSRPAPPREELTPSELFPLKMGTAPLLAKGYLLHGLVTFLVVIVFSGAVNINRLDIALPVLHLYLTVASFYAVYLLCGKRRPWWLFVGAAAAVVVLLLLYVKWGILGAIDGALPKQWKNALPMSILYAFFRAALPEELIKIAPVLLVWRYGKQLRQQSGSSHLEVREPLDGILLGAAAASGFSVFEGLDYVFRGAAEAGIAVAFGQMILRSIGQIFGHAAYTGIFGYYVGLAALRPKHARDLILRGFLTAAGFHAIWNGVPGTLDSPLLMLLCGGFFYAALVAAILRARKLSPTRASNLATSLGGQG